MNSKIHLLLLESMGLKMISKQKAIDQNMFGPVYHGTTDENFENIKKSGFDLRVGDAGSDGISNGYTNAAYGGGVDLVPPVHHLGYGIYMTTKKDIAKKYSYGNTKVLKEYYVDAPRLLTINWGATNTMMKWWIKMGYPAKEVTNGSISRIKGTQILTDNLRNQYDAVWYKGKSLVRLLDGDQVCVFDPANIYMVDPTLVNDFDIGSKVKRKWDGNIGTIMDKRKLEGDVVEMRKNWLKMISKIIDALRAGDDSVLDEYPKYTLRTRNGLSEEDRNLTILELEREMEGIQGMLDAKDYSYYRIKWNKGGIDYNVYRGSIEPYHGRIKA